MKISVNIHFNGQCKQALKLYEKAFNSKVATLLYFKDAHKSDFDTSTLTNAQKNYVYHSEMYIGDYRFMFSDELQPIKVNQNISIIVIFNSDEEVKTAFEILKENAAILQPIRSTTYSSCLTSLIDQFGVRWELMTEL
ncbi:VOC family protein [Clostridium sp. 'deep sea']|uniref:VOC family protein n=1 Tax=Clostridium sp. 'deep sea' TaxID=2779445 RepID=UPI0018967462|nr:VOC family protein [Clostridium sp. 'deep sea']QOR34890.1 VOC family protein [Clostridium sp. 'deep sea']